MRIEMNTKLPIGCHSIVQSAQFLIVDDNGNVTLETRYLTEFGSTFKVTIKQLISPAIVVEKV